MRVLLTALAGAAMLLLAACSDSGGLDHLDGGTGDSGDTGTAGAPDAAPGDASDAGRRDLGPTEGDATPFPCDPFAAPASPETPAALTGRLDITDYDAFDDTFTHARARNRVGGFNFLTGTMPVQPLSDGALFRGIELDRCLATDIAVSQTPLGPARNIGTALYLTGTGTISVAFRRDADPGGPMYRAATQADLLRLFNPRAVALDGTWTWWTPGDAAAGIRAADAVVGPVEDFEVTPAFTATRAPAVLDLAGTTIRWTAPRAAGGEMAIVLARALNPMGDAHYLICRPADDGEFTISAADLTAFGPTRGLAFDLAVSRTAFAAFCNEGVPSGAAVHTLVYLGAAVVP